MSTIVTRSGKGSPLTHNEVDANFTNLDTDKVEKTAAAITGGTINGTTIGATTPSTVNATTITGQTARLNGTGTNLVLQSQNFENAAWTKTAVTATASGATAPDSTSTAITILETVANSAHNFAPTTALTTSSGALYTISVYVKANGRNFCAVYEGASAKGKFFNITAGGGGSVLGNLIGAPVSATLTYVGNDWYRASIVVTAGAAASPSVYLSTDGTTFSYTGNASLGIFAWGMQLEFGSTANTYIPTTTTAVYGTPTLSFSGVSEIGLLSTGALYLQPAGTGALQAQATTSTTAGGNARGTNAVDWQTSRTAASQVASAGQSVIAGGINNTASGQYSVVSGGFSNTNNGFLSNIVGGLSNNTSSGIYAVIGGGSNNSLGATGFQVIAGGYLNTSAGYYNFIGGGFTNSTTSGSAVTTQSGTMNATTAVTLSGSNANIKVGQYISGTSIAGDTYVAAISGTSLTLSKAASGSSTSTLSFFTPHGVVVGGGNNQATGSYSFIGGGGDAGTAANRNVASGDFSVVVGGIKNIGSGLYSFVGGGYNNTANNNAAFMGGGGFLAGSLLPNLSQGQSSGVVSGISNNATGNASFIGAGYGNAMNGQYSASMGGSFGNARSISGNHVFAANVNPISQSSGITQSALLVLAVQTTDATATALRSDGNAASGTNQVILPNNSAYFFTGEVISGVTGGGNTKGFTIEGVIKRGANAASTALVGTPTVTSTYADAGASTWAIAVTADTTNGGLRVTFTGQAATTIRTVCQIRTTEMTY